MNSTNSSTLFPRQETEDQGACMDPTGTALQWSLFGVFLLLAFLSKLLVSLLFKGVAPIIKIAFINASLQTLLTFPTSFLLLLGFFQIAFFSYFPWPCSLSWLKTALGNLLFILILAGAFFLIKRTFNFLRIALSYFQIPARYSFAVFEGLDMTQIIVLVITGVLFFVLTISRLFGRERDGDFSPSTFLYEINLITLVLLFILLPVLRDAVGGFYLLFDRPFATRDEVAIDGKRGIVERIGLFAVVLRDVRNGSMILVPTSRFVERDFILIRAQACAVHFSLPLPAARTATVDERSTLIAMESKLLSREYYNVCVTFEEDKTALDVRFLVPEPKMNQREINQAKFALIELAKQLYKIS